MLQKSTRLYEKNVLFGRVLEHEPRPNNGNFLMLYQLQPQRPNSRLGARALENFWTWFWRLIFRKEPFGRVLECKASWMPTPITIILWCASNGGVGIWDTPLVYSKKDFYWTSKLVIPVAEQGARKKCSVPWPPRMTLFLREISLHKNFINK